MGPSGTAADPRRYRSFPDLVRVPLGDGAELVYALDRREARSLSPLAVRLLLGCPTFATLPEHAGRLLRELNAAPGGLPTLLHELSALAAAGLLVSSADLEARARPRSDAAPPPITTVGVPTRDRPDCLRRCLESHLEAARRRGRKVDWIVVDGSADAAVREANRAVLRSLRDRGGALFYAGPEEKAVFADALVRQAGLPAEAVAFALLNPENCPVTTGANRNALLLHAAGEMLLQVDDDTTARLVAPPMAGGPAAFSSRFDPTEFWFPDEAGAVPAAVPVDDDLLAVHERLLGREPGACGGGEAVDPEQASAGFFRRLEAPAARVAVSAAGVVGDAGMGSSVYFLTLEGGSRVRLLADEAVYRRVVATRRVLRAVRRATVCDDGVCVALNLGLDHRTLLPPFLPVQRNQDGVFVSLLRACPGAFLGYLPLAVAHEPPPRPPAAPADMAADLTRFRSGHVLQLLVRSLLPGTGGDAAAGLRAAGRALAETAALPPADFAERVRFAVWQQMSRQAVLWSWQLRQFGGQPAFWAEDVRRLLAVLRDGLADARCADPVDLGPDAAAGLRRLALALGRLLLSWPDMVEAARDLRRRGVRPAVPV